MDDFTGICLDGGMKESVRRVLRRETLEADFVVVGGGLAGVCCALTAARAGIRVILIQDRPVLGGNASSEVRLWALGATSHMGNNNRWAREGGVIDEILVENTFRNPEGNPLLFDVLLLEKVSEEPKITLLLNTAVYDLEKSEADAIRSVRAFCSQNSTEYVCAAPLFCDASGDGIAGFLAGAAFRMGCEACAEFGEEFAGAEPTAELLGHTIYFYSKDVGRPVKFVAPSFALKDITLIPRWREIRARDHGCAFWWLEWGGKFDTVHDSEKIKWELWKVAYGFWNHVKNSGQFPEAETLTLEWIGAIPGKRESRRFEGDMMLSQRDIVEQRVHSDAVSFGGWAIDLHPVDGVYSDKPSCVQWHSKGVYQIPYRCLYSRNIANLFLTGRAISSSHIAMGSTRVMLTCAHNGQAVGMAAALCSKDKLRPRDLACGPRLEELQRELLRVGQYIPHVRLADPEDLACRARVTASSELRLAELEPNGETLLLTQPWAMMLPVGPGPMPLVTVTADVTAATSLRAELRVSGRADNHTPDVTLKTLDVELSAGNCQSIPLKFDAAIERPCYAFVCLMTNDNIAIQLSEQRLTGVLSVTHHANKAVAKSATQAPPKSIGIDSFEFWTPQRRPGGKNFAIRVEPPIDLFGAANLMNGFARPTAQPNAWVAEFADPAPAVTLKWSTHQTINRIELSFDSDFDHPMESVQMGHPERVMPFCVRRFRVVDSAGKVLAARDDNHQSHQTLRFDPPAVTDCLTVQISSPMSSVPVALFAVRCY